MNLKDIIIVGIALAMDAVGVTVSIGVNPKVIRRNKIAFIMSFAIFQFLFFLLGDISFCFCIGSFSTSVSFINCIS